MLLSLRHLSRSTLTPALLASSLIASFFLPAAVHAQSYTLIDLGTLGGSYSFGNSVNDKGQVVGDSYLDTSTNSAAFLYSGGKMINLNTLISPTSGFFLTGASGISDTGFITGAGINAQGRQDAFLLIPIPAAVSEASTTVSFGLLALGGVVVAARKKKTAASD